jgi:hypothetical protein
MMAVLTRMRPSRASVGPIFSVDIRNSLVAARDRYTLVANAPHKTIRVRNQYQGMLEKASA